MSTSNIKVRPVEGKVTGCRWDGGNYRLAATITRPVTFEGDPDCQDTYGIRVSVSCSVGADGEVWFHDAQVIEDLRADDGTIAYHRSETLEENSYSAANIAELNAAFVKQRKAERARYEYDPADEMQDFPPDNVESIPADHYDQRRVLRRAA